MAGPGLKQVIERHRAELLAIPGVNGVAAGRTQDGRSAVLVYGNTKERPAQLPAELEGYPVEFHRTGDFRARGG